jgi:hypothetical protein
VVGQAAAAGGALPHCGRRAHRHGAAGKRVVRFDASHPCAPKTPPRKNKP